MVNNYKVENKIPRAEIRLAAFLTHIAGLFFATSVIAGPFGLEMGMTLKDIGGKPQKLSPGHYLFSSVPKPHSAFESYVIELAPKAGLCWIKAVGKDIQTAPNGFELKARFQEMEQKLEKIYGKHQEIDSLMSGSTWTDSQYFTMGLLQKERVLGASWDAEHESTLTDNLASVTLYVSATSRHKGYISIEYGFVNEKTCDAEISAKEDDAL